MRAPEFRASGLREGSWKEHGLRFFFGGVVSVAAALVARAYGPSVGGLFLAFPAILPASLTLAKKHDGREAAIDEARGALAATAGLVAFAFAVRALSGRSPALVLVSATLAWALVSCLLWLLLFGRRS